MTLGVGKNNIMSTMSGDAGPTHRGSDRTLDSSKREEKEGASSRHSPTNLRELSDSVVRAVRDSRRNNASSSSLSRLKLSNLRLHGRDDEVKLLKSKLRDFDGTRCGDEDRSATRQSEMLLIAGVSGVGKSVLVKKSLEEPARKMGLTFAGGKFDLNKASALPLSAFSSAMSTLANDIIARGDAHIIREAISDELKKDEMERLIAVMPGLGVLFYSEQHEKGNRSSVGVGRNSFVSTTSFCDEVRTSSIRSEGSFNTSRAGSLGDLTSGGMQDVNRLQYEICKLLKVITTHSKGLVLFIDDLQWSDIATIKVLNSIVNENIRSVLIVGAYREDEVSDSHPLTLQIKDSQESGIKISIIKIGSLSVNCVKSLLADVLDMEGDENKLSMIAVTIHKKTDGNVFYVLAFLKSLCDEDLLQFNFGAYKWIWDDNAVNAKLITENVATIMLNKLQQYDRSSQAVLQVAACIGATFHMSMLVMIMEGLPTDMAGHASLKNDSAASVSSLLEYFEREGLIEKEKEMPIRYHFSHDQIQSAALELIQEEARDMFRGKMGDILMRGMTPKEVDENLFVIVGLRNHGMPSMSGAERQKLARMNLRAGHMAAQGAAFDTAVTFYRAGRASLGENAWENDADTILKLCSGEANACFINGDIPTMNMLIDEVLAKDISVERKFKVYEVKIMEASAGDRFEEAINTAVLVRKQLGLPCPTNKPVSPLVILKEYIKTSRLLGKRTPEDIANLPLLKDKRIIMGQRLLDLAGAPVMWSQPTMFPIIVFLQVQACIIHGVNATSCNAFASFGLILAGLKKFKRARDMAVAAELLLKNPEYGQMQSLIILLCEAAINHWTSPLQATLSPLLVGYQRGLEVGDIQRAGNNLACRMHYLWHAGRPLDMLLNELETSLVAFGKLKQETPKQSSFAIALTVKKFRGMSCADDKMKSFEDVLRNAAETDNKALRAFGITLQMDTLVFFQDWDAAITLLKKAGNVRGESSGMYGLIRFTMLEALVCMKAARVEKKWLRKAAWERRAMKSMKLIGNWLKKGNVNCVHFMHLLKAEAYHGGTLTKGNTLQAKEQYKKAITVAATNGFLQDKGLANELAGYYHLKIGDDYRATYFLECAEVAYADWGAVAKVAQLKEKRKSLLGES